MTAANNTHRDNKWSASLAAAAAALSVLVSVIAPVGAEQLVNAVPEREPLVQALVQLPDEESDWTRWDVFVIGTICDAVPYGL